MAVRRARVLAVALILSACALAPPSPAQARLDACLAQADRRVITAAQLEPNNQFSYAYIDAGGGGAEIEKFVACMEGRAPLSPPVR